MGTYPNQIYNFGYDYTQNCQMINKTSNFIEGMITATKHFVGDGATVNVYDEGMDLVYNFSSFYSDNGVGFEGATDAQTGTFMVSYSSVNNIPMSINSILLTDYMKNKKQFDGFFLSDYDEITKLSSDNNLPSTFIKLDYKQVACMMINAGIDM